MKNVLKIMVIAVFITVISLGVTAFADNTFTGVITADVLNIRSLPNIDSLVVGQLQNGTEITVTETVDNWYKIIYNDSAAFVCADYVTAYSEPDSAEDFSENYSVTGFITADVINVRSLPSTDSFVVGQFQYGDTVTVTEAKDNWYQITYGVGSAFLCSDYVSVDVEPVFVEEFSSISSLANGDNSGLSKGEMLVEYAKKYIGTPYVYGGMSPSGFDCSGFVKFCYAYMGVDINRVAEDQAKNGYEVSINDMKPGDILCFASSIGGSYIGHSGIYVGNGQFIHSPREGYTVEIIPLTYGSYDQRLVNIRRIFD